eukprot:2253004-Prymnesium_polylepis.1
MAAERPPVPPANKPVLIRSRSCAPLSPAATSPANQSSPAAAARSPAIESILEHPPAAQQHPLLDVVRELRTRYAHGGRVSVSLRRWGAAPPEVEVNGGGRGERE